MRQAFVVAALATAVAAVPAGAQPADPHAGHSMEKTGGSPSQAGAASAALPPGADTAAEELKKSPRHGEYVDIKVPGASAPLTTWIVYPERKEKTGVVIVIHEIFGLTDWIRGVADQLAEDGFIAVAPDLLSGKGPKGGGTAELGEEATKVIRTLTPEEVTNALNAVREHTMKLPASNGKVGTVGFCWGGSASFAYATNQPALNAAVVYYGGSPQDPAAYERVKAPVLGLYGGNDARVNATIPTAEQEMKKQGKSYAPHTFEGAGHGFLRQQDGQNGANMKATQEAWPLTIKFFQQHLK
jgi:carboxymethylenebutenolidase